MDMKLSGKRSVVKAPEKVVKAEIKPEPPRVQEPEPLPVQSQLEKFSERDSLKRAAVFTSGWQAPLERHEEKNALQKRITQTPRMKVRSKYIRKPLVILLLASIILAIGYFGAMHFEKTTIVIKEKKEMLTLDHNPFTALKGAEALLHFEIMIVSDSDTKNMVLTESENVTTYATGTVTIYNEWSTKPVTIAVHSFLTDAQGKTYRVDKATTIPGYKTVNGKIVPGQAQVGITAFLPGDSYNSKSTDFTFSAYKGTAKLKKIYAKATTPIAGGAQGLVYVLGSGEKGSLNATALSTLKSRLLTKVNAEVPKGYILYPDALTFTYVVDENIKSPTPEANVKIDSTLSAVILKESDVKDVVIKNSLPKVDSIERKEIDVPDISKLTFAFQNLNQVVTKDMQSVPFTLTGTANAIWHPDLESLKSKVSGIQKTELTAIWKTDPGISEARATLFPPWQKHLPDEISKIHITTVQ